MSGTGRAARTGPSCTVVITGGRAPSALDLARHFAAAGVRVVLADSQPMMGARSAAVSKAYRIPSPRFRPREAAEAVARIAERHGAQLVVPTCEEVFWLAAVWPASTEVRLFAPPPEVLRRLHDKAEFAAVLDELGIAHPRTEVLTSTAALRGRAARRSREAPEELVLKPAFSRFASRTRFVGERHALPDVGPVTPEWPWIVQSRVRGRELCCWAVAVGGRLTALAVYRPVWRAGSGAGVAFERVGPTDPAAASLERAASALAEAFDLTAQFGLDAIDDGDTVHLLECNPRATSGIHLFTPADRLADAFPLGASQSQDAAPLTPGRAAARLGLPHLLYGPAGIVTAGWPGVVTAAARHARQRKYPDVLREPGDPVRAAVLLRSLGVQARTALSEGIPLLAASTHDIEWNGEALRPAPGACGWADTFAGAFRGQPSRILVANTDVTVDVVQLGAHRLPVTVPTGASSAEPPSYVVSPLSHWVHYSREELDAIDSALTRRLATGVIGLLERILGAARIDDTVFVGNALLSTNLLPDPSDAEVEALTRALVAEHPSSAIAWRSVHGRGSGLPGTLRRCGYRLVPSRSVLFTTTRDEGWLRTRDSRRDLRLTERSDYRLREAPVDESTGMSSPELRERIAHLYGLLYTERYSRLNPRYTAEFVGVAQRSGLLRFVLLVRPGGDGVTGDLDPSAVDGVFGYTVAHGLLAAPIVGYDTALPRDLGLYRMLALAIGRTAAEHGVDLHGSSGVADFKRARGAEEEIEYTAVYTRHLGPARQAAWRLLETVVRRVAVPLVRRAGL